MPVIVRLDPRTLALHETATADLSEGLVFGGGDAWALDTGRPQLAVVDPLTGKVIRTVTTPPPSTTGDDYVVADVDLLWVFRGSRLSQLNPATGRIMTSARIDPIAPAFYSPAVVVGRGLWYLAQTGRGIMLDRIVPARDARIRWQAGTRADHLAMSPVLSHHRRLGPVPDRFLFVSSRS